MSIRLIIADDHPSIRDGLQSAIARSGKNIKVVGEASDGLEALEIARTIPFDVALLDITMPKRNGIETARELIGKFPDAKIVMLSLHASRVMVEEAFAAGARGYLTKETATQNVVDAVIQVHAGGYYLSPSITHFVIEAGLAGIKRGRKRADTAVALTGQERKVLQLVAEGGSTKEVAVVLGVSVNTVHSHRNRLMAKLKFHKQADLIHYAIKAGIAKV